MIFSCSKEEDFIPETETPIIIPELEVNEVNDFIYNAMNEWYLYKDEQPLLANDYFKTTEEKIDFINNGGTPEEFFELLKVDNDEFSSLNNDVNLQARYLWSTRGFRYRIVSVNAREIIGVILQVYRGSNAEILGVKRGDLFNKIDNVVITDNNYQDLLSKSNFLLGRVLDKGLDSEGNVVFEDRDEISISFESLEENPIVISKTLNINGIAIGYLFYKYFEREYSNALNNEFALFKANGVKDFVIDLRYNSGGNELALYELASMLTGQFNGQVFLEEKYNNDIENDINRGIRNININNNFRDKLNDGETINSLELSKLYVITSGISASSSELLIHCLKPYINVVVIGDEDGTRGKGVSKREMYDAPNFFSKDDINFKHNYFLDLVRIHGVNNNGEILDDSFGILPDKEATESPSNLGQLGDENEKLLKLAIDDILGRWFLNHIL